MNDLEKNAHPWFALQVRTRTETAISSALAAKGFPVFCPTYIEARKWSDRIRKLEVALFSSYAFCSFDPEKRLPILQTPGVISVVGVAGEPLPIEGKEIAALRKAVEHGSLQPWPYLNAGSRVVIQQGAMQGVEGTVTALKGEDHLVITISLLQRSVAMKIEREWVRPI